MEYINELGYLDVKLLPLSNNEEERTIQEKIINGQELTFKERLRLRDNAVTKLEDYELKSDHIYRATHYKCLTDYIEKGYINDEDGKGYSNEVHWYLGGTSKRYGKVIIEANALPEKLKLTDNYGGLMSGSPYVRHVTTTQENPIMMDDVSRIFFLDCTGDKVLKMIDMNNLKDINLEAREGNLLHQIDFLERKKETFKDFDEQELLDSLKNELLTINEELNNKKVL